MSNGNVLPISSNVFIPNPMTGPQAFATGAQIGPATSKLANATEGFFKGVQQGQAIAETALSQKDKYGIEAQKAKKEREELKNLEVHSQIEKRNADIETDNKKIDLLKENHEETIRSNKARENIERLKIQKNNKNNSITDIEKIRKAEAEARTSTALAQYHESNDLIHLSNALPRDTHDLIQQLRLLPKADINKLNAVIREALINDKSNDLDMRDRLMFIQKITGEAKQFNEDNEENIVAKQTLASRLRIPIDNISQQEFKIINEVDPKTDMPTGYLYQRDRRIEGDWLPTSYNLIDKENKAVFDEVKKAVYNIHKFEKLYSKTIPKEKTVTETPKTTEATPTTPQSDSILKNKLTTNLKNSSGIISGEKIQGIWERNNNLLREY